VGTVVDVGRTRYRPPAGLADLVRARDRGCTHPGCEVPARGCDLDHITPWASGGTTSLENLTCLCRAHHRLKHTPGWALTRTGDGALIWRTPTGARYRREPDGAIALLPRRTGPRQAVASAVRVPDALARAVTPAVQMRLFASMVLPLFRVMVMDFCLVKMTGYGIKRAPFWQLNHTNAVFDAPGACGLERLRVWRPNPLWSKNNE